ncbi:MAG: hypothetical protein QF464_00810, partial [Myxococcota bacterium]|nr:hypothetical protein [Myxococcota bacterium]
MRHGDLLIVLALVTAPTDAFAYVLERSDTGALVHWPQTCVSWWMQANGCADVGPSETREVMRASFETWDVVADM